MSKHWKLAEKIPQKISQDLSAYPKVLQQILYNRGFKTSEAAEVFLRPEYNQLLDPNLFKDMQKAVKRIWQAVKNGEKICIYGDYDADAVTANAVLQQTLRYMGGEVESYIPDRFAEGYGVNLDAVGKIIQSGVKIIITVDCGTNSTDAADFCKLHGVDFIVTDHHEIIGELPKAYALINPKNPEDLFPYKEITGVGVAFKLASALLAAVNEYTEYVPPSGDPINPQWAKWLLDLVAIGTVADCHSLIGENRILTHFGLKVLEKTKWTGLRQLMNAAGLENLSRSLDAYALGYVIAPRLNAAGRLEHANVALHLLMEQDSIEALNRAFALEEINRRRQQLTEQILSEAREQAEQHSNRKFLVLMGKDWPKGVVGLVAGKIAEEFNKPTIVLSQEGDLATGSARTVGGYSVIESLIFAKDYLLRFGGHKQAAGLTLKAINYSPFYQAVLLHAESHLEEEDMKKIIYLDAELEPDEINLRTYEGLEKFGPFGVDNIKPRFFIQGLKIQTMRLVGVSQNHLQLSLGINGRLFKAIGFNLGSFAKRLKVGDTINAAVELMKDHWNGNEELKIRLIDIQMLN